MSKRALLSVSDKTGLVDFAQALVAAGYDLISTGGTATALRTAGLKVSDISDVTGFPEMLDGRVKTLHPKVHGGLLFLRDNPEHQAQAQAHDIAPIDLVVVNLYPFEQTIAKPDVTLEHAIENIDIGGPSMLRSAAKNYRSVTVITDPADYAIVAGEIGAQGDTTLETRERLAAKVFRITGYYDALIAQYLTQRVPSAEAFPETFALPMRRAQTLRYGENPHQVAALYGPFAKNFQQLHGKELSYNNLIDITGAVRLIREFHGAGPTVAILKHTNPCGVGSGATLPEAWDKAYATDRQAPFGGIIVVNRPLDLAAAQLISEIFSEVIIAPAFDEDALAL
jgi:phosphoribosylaminoimidazolecarboxamide formyltransferase/IMP cyclohydrolase